MNTQIIIFTDLDGTLLEHQTYDFASAQATLQRVRELGVPLIFCSSKTRTEQEYYQQQMNIRAPMILENGAAITLPKGYFNNLLPDFPLKADYRLIELGIPVHLIRHELGVVREHLQLNFRGFAELSLTELREWTGLDEAAAQRALQREYSETIVGELSDEQLEALKMELHERGLSCTRGSRFLTISSRNSDKGQAVRMLTNLFQEEYEEFTTIGLGDGANDLPMLRVVDQAYFLQDPGKPEISADIPHLKIIRGAGPEAWSAVVNELLTLTFPINPAPAQD